MLRMLAAFGSSGITFLVLDAVWLSTMLPTYRQHIGQLLFDGVRLGPAGAFYLLYVTGMVVLVVLPASNGGGGWLAAALNGALLGLVAYGTYDLTNQATLKVWPLAMTLMDMAWGTVLTAVSAAVGTVIAGYVSPSGVN